MKILRGGPPKIFRHPKGGLRKFDNVYFNLTNRSGGGGLLKKIYKGDD